MTRVIVLGCPRPCGGANTELGETILLWRRMGISVDIVPTWVEHKTNPWPTRLREAGCRLISTAGVVTSSPEAFASIPDLAGSIVVAFCNSTVVQVWPILKRNGCRLVYSPCMCEVQRFEHKAFNEYPPVAVHYQSTFQRDRLETQYTLWKVPHFLIHGAFDTAAHPFCPRPRGTGPFFVGRLARRDPLKWSKDLWPVLEGVHADIRFAAMAWSMEIQAKCGEPPSWATCLPQESMPVNEFLANLHCLLCLGDTPENWPRVGLEAMAAGVPVVAENSGGWPEMIEHGKSGMLCSDRNEFSKAITLLAKDKSFRQSIIANARERVATLANFDTISAGWSELFKSIGG